jgi:predicted AAA+ superfamily ATPase
MFHRNATEQLKKWAEKENRKPLILRGARQVGKTTLIHEFGKEFSTYLYLNLEDKLSSSIFDVDKGVDDILTTIYLYCNKARTDGKTLLFIDEIQNSANAISKLRYFFEEIPTLFVIAAGSLLDSLINVHISFPVGRVEYMAIYPCTFNEFLGALGEIELQKAISIGSIPDALHVKTMNLFNTYTLIGGMPEVVDHYAKHKDLVSLNDIYESLLIGYKNDVEKYSHNQTMTQVIRYVLQEGWAFAAQCITLGNFAGSAYKSREMGEAFRTLEKTMLLELVYPTLNYSIPINRELKRSPKLIWFDTGLVNYSAKLQKEVFGARDIQDAWRGGIAEQIVAQELAAKDYRVSNKRTFWVRDKKGSQAEVDFVIQYENMLIPIEVKSGHNAKLKSLHSFMEKTNHSIAVRVWSNFFSVDKVTTSSGKTFDLYNIPFYYVGILEKLFQN